MDGVTPAISIRHRHRETSSMEVAFAIASSSEQVCLNFRPFSYPRGSAISFLRTVPALSFSRPVSYGTTAAPTGLRSGLPAPLNRLDRSKRPALLPGPAAHSSPMRAAPSPAGDPAPAVLRRSVGKRLLGRPSISLASNKRQIRFSQHYRCLPDAPRSDPTTRSAGLVTVSPTSPAEHGIETRAKVINSSR
jgi:hypothetical protein